MIELEAGCNIITINIRYTSCVQISTCHLAYRVRYLANLYYTNLMLKQSGDGRSPKMIPSYILMYLRKIWYYILVCCGRTVQPKTENWECCIVQEIKVWITTMTTKWSPAVVLSSFRRRTKAGQYWENPTSSCPLRCFQWRSMRECHMSWTAMRRSKLVLIFFNVLMHPRLLLRNPKDFLAFNVFFPCHSLSYLFSPSSWKNNREWRLALAVEILAWLLWGFA